MPTLVTAATVCESSEVAIRFPERFVETFVAEAMIRMVPGTAKGFRFVLEVPKAPSVAKSEEDMPLSSCSAPS